MSPSPTVALVGCGHVTSEYYIPALAALQRYGLIEVRAVVDTDPARADEAAAALDGAATPAPDAGWSAGCDLVIVATPPQTHAELVAPLLRAGHRVSCEKPLAPSGPEAQALAAIDQGQLSVNFNRRFFPAVERIGALVSDGALGSPRRFEIFEGGRFEWAATDPGYFETSNGGVLDDLGSHAFDLVRCWFGDCSIATAAGDGAGGLDVNLHIQLTTTLGVDGTLRLSRDWPQPVRYSIEFERGEIGWSPHDPELLDLRIDAHPAPFQANLSDPPVGVLGTIDEPYARSFAAQILDVIDGPAPRNSAASAAAVASLCDDVRRAWTPLELGWLGPDERAGWLARREPTP